MGRSQPNKPEHHEIDATIDSAELVAPDYFVPPKNKFLAYIHDAILPYIVFNDHLIARWQQICGVKYRGIIFSNKKDEKQSHVQSSSPFFSPYRAILPLHILFCIACEFGNELFFGIWAVGIQVSFAPLIATEHLILWGLTLYLCQLVKDSCRLPRPGLQHLNKNSLLLQDKHNKKIKLQPKSSSNRVVRLEHHYNAEFGFPSGHSAVICLPIYTLYCLYASYSTISYDTDPMMSIISHIYYIITICGCLYWIIATPLARLYVGVHSVVDVTGGIFCGLLASIILFILKYYNIILWFLTSQFGPYTLLFICIIAALSYPIHEYIWTNSGGDTALILGTICGCLFSNHFIIQLNNKDTYGILISLLYKSTDKISSIISTLKSHVVVGDGSQQHTTTTIDISDNLYITDNNLLSLFFPNKTSIYESELDSNISVLPHKASNPSSSVANRDNSNIYLYGRDIYSYLDHQYTISTSINKESTPIQSTPRIPPPFYTHISYFTPFIYHYIMPPMAYPVKSYNHIDLDSNDSYTPQYPLVSLFSSISFGLTLSLIQLLFVLIFVYVVKTLIRPYVVRVLRYYHGYPSQLPPWPKIAKHEDNTMNDKQQDGTHIVDGDNSSHYNDDDISDTVSSSSRLPYVYSPTAQLRGPQMQRYLSNTLPNHHQHSLSATTTTTLPIHGSGESPIPDMANNDTTILRRPRLSISPSAPPDICHIEQSIKPSSFQQQLSSSSSSSLLTLPGASSSTNLSYHGLTSNKSTNHLNNTTNHPLNTVKSDQCLAITSTTELPKLASTTLDTNQNNIIPSDDDSNSTSPTSSTISNDSLVSIRITPPSSNDGRPPHTTTLYKHTYDMDIPSLIQLEIIQQFICYAIMGLTVPLGQYVIWSCGIMLWYYIPQ